jgi:hypothetical protein
MNTDLYKAKVMIQDLKPLCEKFDYSEFILSHLFSIEIEINRQIKKQEKSKDS